ncbi:MAG: hypothetical protein GC155_17045 [Alphaproteobacteria bacterium]|nr:hypothetical protein [Alphaproteobacteria bacterium]
MTFATILRQRVSSTASIAPWLAGFAIAAAILLAGYGGAAMRQDFTEPDNAMRLVEVRDFIDGQGWFDLTEKRLNPPDGTPMHWARWIDAAIAAPIELLKPFSGQHTAEVAAGFIWPFALLALFMWLIVRISADIGARDGLRTETSWAAALVAALALPALDKFAPGAFDHHNVELVCALGGLLGLISMARTPHMGALAGLALGLMLATAAEAAPIVAAATLAAGLLWLVRPDVYARGLAWFGGGLALSSSVMFVALVPRSHWRQPVCDAMSTPFLGFGLAAGAVALLLAIGLPAVARATLLRRLVSAGVAGAVALGALYALFPECARGGYAALGPDMTSLWLVQISEARSLATLAADNPGMAMGVAGSAFAGLAAAVVYLWRRPPAEGWAPGWIAAGFLVAALGLTIWEIRGAYFATAFAIPFGGWAAARARSAWQASPSPKGLAIFALVAAGSAAAVWASLGQQVQAHATPSSTLTGYKAREASSRDCMKPEAFAPLQSMEHATFLNNFMLGPGVLQWTGLSVIAGPYHRDATGTMTMINALRSDTEAARPIIQRALAGYVLVCPALPEMAFYARHPANGAAPQDTLAARLNANAPPDWLTRVPLEGTPLRLYRIQR